MAFNLPFFFRNVRRKVCIISLGRTGELGHEQFDNPMYISLVPAKLSCGPEEKRAKIFEVPTNGNGKLAVVFYFR